MARKKYTSEDIIIKLREIDIALNQGSNVDEAVRKIGVNKNTYYKWKKEFGGLEIDQAKRLKELERENARLKKLVADQALDNAMLKEIATGNF